MTYHAVVDTNVVRVADSATHPDPEWPLECAAACVAALRRVRGGGRIVLDQDGRILQEYFSNVARAGAQLGAQFATWVHDHQWNEEHCVRVPITPSDDSFVEFPPTEALAGFDPADRKFIAVAAACREKVEVLQATDSKWWLQRKALADADIEVNFVCEDLIKQLADDE